VRVRVEDKSFLIKLPDTSCKVAWLAEETIKRYYSMKKIRPVIHLTTKDGALLSCDDLIVDVITDNEIFAKVESFEVAALHVRYGQECQSVGIIPLPDIELELQAVELSGILNLAHASISNKHFAAVLKVLKGCDAIRCLDLSYTRLPLTRHFAEVVSSLARLEELRLQCTGANRLFLSWLSKYNMSINHLDLSFNPLDCTCLDHILDLLVNFSSLRTLILISCDLGVEDFRNERLVETVNRKSHVQRLLVDGHIAQELIPLYEGRLEFRSLGSGLVRINSTSSAN
jgi:hypothetical protein